MLAFGRPVNTIYRLQPGGCDRFASTPISWPAAPAIFAYARQFADKRRVQSNVTHTPQPKEDWQEGYQDGSDSGAAPINPRIMRQTIADRLFCRRRCRPKESRRRNHAESAVRGGAVSFSHRQHGGSPLSCFTASEIEAWAWDLAAALGVGGAVQRESTKKSPPSRKDLQAHKGACLVVAGDYQPPAVHALAHAMNARARQRRQNRHLYRSIEGNPVDQRNRFASWSPT